MRTFAELSELFEEKFNCRHFPNEPATLYNPAQYILSIGGKRIRPVCVLMGNELFGELGPNAFNAGLAVELFHNFTLIHDDIMDNAPLRRGKPTVHVQYGTPTAILTGDVMFAQSYDYISRVSNEFIHPVLSLFNKTTKEVCEGQQLDMDFEQKQNVSIEEYLQMIALKTSVLLGASMQLGAILGGAGKRNQQLMYEFGKNLGIAFQVQDDYLDAFGNPDKFGKQVGGDILLNKKTILLLFTRDNIGPQQKNEFNALLQSSNKEKVGKMLLLYKSCGADIYARQLKEKYYKQALQNLEEVAVISSRKKALQNLAEFLLNREK
ncbi:MAG: polyprenyl synthetase family protein [Chitinophagaceae bacterium]|nr:polyprenyl synthetase family protein [Chitinophagaceae bacterium]MBK9957604.1 polyprenyl synthetase family protein [Chitinophagaceae bacterium]QQS63814.1 MAG: polyprenyl synthetase family protein [Chitinophagaceae bacterium]